MQLKPDLKCRTLTIDIHLQSIRVLALSKNRANGANRANRGAGNPVLGQLSGRKHVGAGSEPAPTTGKEIHSSWRVSSSRAEQITKFY